MTIKLTTPTPQLYNTYIRNQIFLSLSVPVRQEKLPKSGSESTFAHFFASLRKIDEGLLQQISSRHNTECVALVGEKNGVGSKHSQRFFDDKTRTKVPKFSLRKNDFAEKVRKRHYTQREPLKCECSQNTAHIENFDPFFPTPFLWFLFVLSLFLNDFFTIVNQRGASLFLYTFCL